LKNNHEKSLISLHTMFLSVRHPHVAYDFYEPVCMQQVNMCRI